MIEYEYQNKIDVGNATEETWVGDFKSLRAITFQ